MYKADKAEMKGGAEEEVRSGRGGVGLGGGGFEAGGGLGLGDGAIFPEFHFLDEGGRLDVGEVGVGLLVGEQIGAMIFGPVDPVVAVVAEVLAGEGGEGLTGGFDDGEVAVVEHAEQSVEDRGGGVLAERGGDSHADVGIFFVGIAQDAQEGIDGGGVVDAL